MKQKYLKLIAKIKRNISEFKKNCLGNKKTHMESEIEEQPQIIDNLLKRYCMPDGYIMINIPLYVNKVILVASGSSYNCAAIISGLMRKYAHINAQSIYSSELANSNEIQIEENTLYVFISQSGETSDTLKALRIIGKNTPNTLSVTNNEGSAIYEEANYKLLIYSGYEASIAATKSLTAQLVSLILLTAKIMQSKKIDITPLIVDLKEIPQKLTKLLENKQIYKNIARNFAKYNNITLLGTGIFYPVAKEGALKIREITYINTNAYPMGEFLHGHIAALNNKTAVIAILQTDNKIFCTETIKKIKKDFTPILLNITDFTDEEINEISNYKIHSEENNEIALLFTTLVSLQLISLETAKRLKRNIDKPQGLNKVVRSKN